MRIVAAVVVVAASAAASSSSSVAHAFVPSSPSSSSGVQQRQRQRQRHSPSHDAAAAATPASRRTSDGVGVVALRMDPGGLDAALSGLDAAVTTSIFGAAVAATVKLAGKNDDAVASSLVAEVVPEGVELEVEISEPEPEAESDVAEPEPEAEVEPEVVVAVETEPAPAPAPAPVPVQPAPKDIATLKREVAKNVDTQRVLEGRVAKADAERALKKSAEDKAKAAASKKEAKTAPAVVVPPPQGEVEAEGEVAIATLGRKRHFARRLVKKVVMPWKKWSDL